MSQADPSPPTDPSASATTDLPLDPNRIAREQLEVLAEASLILGASLDYATTLRSLGQFLVPRLADVCVIDLVNVRGIYKRVSITADQPDRQHAMEQLARHFPPDPKHGASRRVMETGKSQIIQHLDEASRARVADSDFHRSLLNASGVHSVMIVPLIVRGQVIGAISLGMADSARSYTTNDLPLVEAIARRAALAVDNARLYRRARKANRHRKRAVKRMRAISDALPLLIAYIDRDGFYRFNNKTYEKWFNLPVSALTGQNTQAMLWGDSVPFERIRPYVEGALAGRPVQFIEDFTYPDGITRTVEGRYIPDVAPDGEVRGFFAMINDISALLKAEEQARLFADVAANIPVGLVIWRLEDDNDPTSLRLIAANPAAIRLAVADLSMIGKKMVEIEPLTHETGRTEIYADVVRNQRMIEIGEVRFPKTESTEEHIYHATAFPLPGRALGLVFDDITERKRIQDHAAMYGDVARHASIGLTLWKLDDLDDPESLQLIAANPAMEAILQQNMQAQIGKRIYEVFPEMAHDSRAEMYADVVRTGQAVELNQYPDATFTDKRLYALRAFPLPGQRVGVAMQDVTDLRRTQQQLTSTLDRTRALYALSRQITMAASPQQILELLLTNTELRRAERASILVFDKVWGEALPDYSEVIAHWSKVPPPVPLHGLRLPIIEYETDRIFDPSNPVIVQNVHTDPRISDAIRQSMSQVGTSSFLMFPLVASAQTFGMVTLQASSPFIISDQELAYIKGLLDQAASAIYTQQLLARETAGRQAAEQSVQDRMRFLAMVSHELRTPLSSIKGFASSLLAEDVTWDTDSQRSFLGVINDEADRLAELVEQVLDLSRLEAGTLSINLQAVTIQQVISSIMPQLLTVCENHHLNFRLDPDLPPVIADSRRIGQVLTNLTNNACKYSPAGSLIEIAASVDGTHLRVSVIDQGVGIPLSERAKVFETFTQASNRPSTETRGVGLGLTIARALIEAHSGDIWIEDTTRQGTTISFTLPLAP